MFRKTLVAVTAATVLGTAALAPTAAAAKGGFGGFHGGRGFGIGFGIATAIGAATVASCWQDQLVVTPRGHYKHVLVNVCQ